MWPVVASIRIFTLWRNSVLPIQKYTNSYTKHCTNVISKSHHIYLFGLIYLIFYIELKAKIAGDIYKTNGASLSITNMHFSFMNWGTDKNVLFYRDFYIFFTTTYIYNVILTKMMMRFNFVIALSISVLHLEIKYPSSKIYWATYCMWLPFHIFKYHFS